MKAEGGENSFVLWVLVMDTASLLQVSSFCHILSLRALVTCACSVGTP